MSENLYDVVVIGGGPAGLTAAIYLARARYRVLVVEKEKFGGQIAITADVVNYPGVESGSGEEITAVMRKQAQGFGAEFLLSAVESVELEGQIKTVRTAQGELQALGVILATGAHPRSTGFQGEEKFKGRGVAYCATCDGEFFTGLDIFVVGGGFAAAEEAIFLTKFARGVTVLVHGDDFSCAKSIADEVKANESITVHYNTVIEEISGDSVLQYARIKNLKENRTWEYRTQEGETFGVFVFAGYEPDTAMFKGVVSLDESGYIITDENRKTNVAGVYAAGDVCVKNLRQMVTAVADGAIAATELERWVADMQKKTGLAPKQPVTRVASAMVDSRRKEGQQQNGGLFAPEIRAQLESVFGKMQKPLVLRVLFDDRPVSDELKAFIQELAGMTENLSVSFSRAEEKDEAPCVRIYTTEGEDTGLAFHGVPGGHEFNSFVIGLYNAAGPGQVLNEDIKARIKAINRPVSLKILVSLSCTMCPELVMAAQHIAAENPFIRADAYDLNHFPAMRETYKVMSVPCIVLDDGALSFGKKNIAQLLDLLAKP
ncbi:MAG: FAD-dependent oxidoreductase [Syntrophomonadaceae bacterium]|jgi:thioredoxin reductase (NADPH)|nr:FAD-dependent oxidoreductase [Syntrophomonadaceae bacterium]